MPHLCDIASIRSGVFARTVPLGDIQYLQLTDFDADGYYLPMAIKDLKRTKTLERHLLQEGDVLFAAKGSKRFATVYRDSYGAAVASSTFLVLTITQRELLCPEYLAMYLTVLGEQKAFSTMAMGSSLPIVSITSLASLEIPLPTLEKQKKLIRVQTLAQRQRALLQQITQLQTEVINRKILQSLHQEKA